MSYYYINTNGGETRCILIHDSYPLPHGVAANCGDNLPVTGRLSPKPIGIANVPCRTGGALSADVYTDAARPLLAKAVKKVSRRKAPAKKTVKKSTPQKTAKKTPTKKAAKKSAKKKAAPKKAAARKTPSGKGPRKPSSKKSNR